MVNRKLGRPVFAILIASLMTALFPVTARQQESKPNQDTEAPRSRDGKKLFGTMEALRVARISSPRLSPDGARVAYLVAENKMEKDKPWKSETQLWLVPTAGPASAARQYTRGEESVSNVQWSPDGKLLGFLMNTGDAKDQKRQDWFMYSAAAEPC